MKKLSEGRLGETSDTIRNIQNKRLANRESTDIVCNADMRVGKVRLFLPSAG
jgi:hypothetical protein